MKKLTPEQIGKMTLNEAWKIAHEFGDFIAKREIPLPIDYESNLPYPKKDILFALIKILAREKPELLRKKYKNLEIKDIIMMLIMALEDFILSEDEYKEKVNEREDFLKEFSENKELQEQWKKWRKILDF